MTSPNPNQWSNGQSGYPQQQYPTDQYGQQYPTEQYGQQYPQPYQPQYQHQQPYPPEPYPPEDEDKGNGWLIALIVLLLAAIIGGLTYAFSSGVFEKDDVSEPVVTSAPKASPTGSAEDPVTGDKDGKDEKAPGGADTSAKGSAPQTSQKNEIKRSYANYAPDTEVTTPEFAAAVFDAFQRAYGETGKTDVTVTATSPVTGMTYSMSCGGTTTVYCSGGNNARVKIWE